MKKKLMLVDSSKRMLLIFLLLCNLEEEDFSFIFDSTFDNELIKRINKPYEIFTNKLIEEKGIKKIILYKKLQRIYKEKLKKYKEYEIYGCDSSFLGIMFSKYKINLLEDGIGMYNILDLYKKNFFSFNMLKRFISNFLLCQELRMGGYNFRVKKIYTTTYFKKYKLPKQIENKREIVDLEALWNKKNNREKDYILKIFNITKEEVEVIKQKISGEKVILLLTQPISELEWIGVPESEKIDLYTKIIKKYPGKKVLIKPHPREKTDYKEIFVDCKILSNSYPIELLFILGLKVERIVTLFSSGVYGMDENTKIDIYGTEVHPKLLKNIGVLPSIKRNAFL